MKLSTALSSLTFFGLMASNVAAQTILDIVNGLEDSSMLQQLVMASPPAVRVFSLAGINITLVAPDDEALRNGIPEDYFADLLTAPFARHLSSLLFGSVILAPAPSSLVDRNLRVNSAIGTDIFLRPENGTILVNEIPVTTADIEATNGIVHVISARPILPFFYF